MTSEFVRSRKGKVKSLRAKLLRFSRDRTFVRFTRKFDDSVYRGYVLDVGPEFFLLALQGEVRFDGFSCFRIADIRSITRDPYADFAESALKKMKQRIPNNPRINLTSKAELLASADRASSLLTIYREKISPDACWIGRVVEITADQVTLWEIGPDAVWDREPSCYELKEITCVEFGGEYESALQLVGGKPPRDFEVAKKRSRRNATP